jgi:hypothetical protein
MPFPISVKDKNLNYILANKALLQALNKSEEELVGKNVKNFVNTFPGEGHDLENEFTRILLEYKLNTEALPSRSR